MEEEIKNLKRVRGSLKSSIANLIKDLTTYLTPASPAEIARVNTTVKNLLMRKEELNEILYDKYKVSQLVQDMMAHLKYIKTVNITKAQLQSANANTSAKKEQSETFNLPQFICKSLRETQQTG